MGAEVSQKKGNKPLISHTLDGEDYCKGVLERFDDAGHLLRHERLSVRVSNTSVLS